MALGKRIFLVIETGKGNMISYYGSQYHHPPDQLSIYLASIIQAISLLDAYLLPRSTVVY